MIDRDPFSNGTEFDSWTSRNCDRCIKASVMKADGSYTKVRCAVQRDIFARMYSDRPISQRSYDACQKLMCPYSVTVRKPRIKKIEGPTLFEDEDTENSTPSGND